MKPREKCGRFYRMILRRVIHDNFGSLPANARDLVLAMRNDEQLKNLLSFVTIAQGRLLSNIN